MEQLYYAEDKIDSRVHESHVDKDSHGVLSNLNPHVLFKDVLVILLEVFPVDLL